VDFFEKMQELPVYFLDVPFQERTKHLVDTYSSLSQDKLADAIGRITKRLGYDKSKLLWMHLRIKIIPKLLR